ncbi:FHA domain-containing protein [bacterium]|nr:FHA domain-containing protein [bacterium]
MADSTPVVFKFRSYSLARQRGELARLRVIKGPDQGSAFVLVNTKATIGRGEENHVVIGDLKASRLHAEISASSSGWMVRDLGSANGILYNGVQSRQSRLKTSDLITIGETTLEFLGPDAEDQLLLSAPREEPSAGAVVKSPEGSKAPARTLSDPFGLRPKALVNASGAGKNAAPGAPSAKSKKAIKLAVAGGLAILTVVGMDFMNKEPPREKQRKISSSQSGPTDLASLMPKIEKPVTSKSAEMFFKQGFREYREGNYLRAMNQFELVLQLSPDHDLARRYRDNARMAIDEEVRSHLEFGKKTLDSGKLRQSRAHYEAILRLLHTDQANPAYIEAKDQLEKVRSEMEAE